MSIQDDHQANPVSASPAAETENSVRAMPTLRERAESALRDRLEGLGAAPRSIAPEDIEKVIHNLRVHQIELEMQNDELRRVQAELDTSQARYFDFYDLAPVGYCTISAVGLIQQANLTTAALLGVSRPALLRTPLSRFIAPIDQIAFHLLCQRILKNHASQECELRMVKQDGTQLWVHLQTIAAVEERGALCMRIVLTNISERKVAEKLRLESEAYLQAIFETEPECIKIVDAQGRLLQMNPAGLAMIEADSLAQVKGAPVVGLITSEHREAFLEMHKRVMAGHAEKMEFEMTGLKGGKRWVETHAVPLRTGGETVHLAVTRDISQRKQMEAQVRQLAFHDALTNLPNRRLLLDHLNQAMSVSKRTGRCCALMFLDLDNFKPLNDQHGHRAGDLLLIEVARRLTSSVREIDTVSRFGGDEFAVLLTDLTADRGQSTSEVAVIAEKIRAKLAEPYVLEIRREGHATATVEHRCSASIGAVVFMGHECSQDEVLGRSDAAMYKAKSKGRNTVVIYEHNAGA
jgi:diguanylate cyclase (GGDEF)-like protein/PAS domain S-box-containing protein